MRLQALTWIRDHIDDDVLPDVSLGQMIAMETRGSANDYIKNMRANGVWVDTPMLLAASAVDNVQLLVFLGPREPQLVAAPSVAASETEVPVCTIANRCNRHFYACRPEPVPEQQSLQEAITDDADRLRASMVDGDTANAPQCDHSEPSEAQCTLGRRTAEPLEVQRGVALFAFCEAISGWNAFGAPDKKVAEKLLALETATSTDPARTCLETLEYRHAIKMLDWESKEGPVSDIDRRHRLRKLSVQRPGGLRAHEFKKSRKILGKLMIDKIRSSVQEPCEKWGKRHTCLDEFRDCPIIVLRWRKVWYALPKADRMTRLVAEFEKGFRDQRLANAGLDLNRMQYTFFGFEVCREAFIKLTGIHADTLQVARGIALGKSGRAQIPQVHRDRASKKYVEARSWLLAYADVHADSSPLRDSLYLPAGRRQYYYAVYFRECVTRGRPPSEIASLDYFLMMWRREFPWIELRAPSGPFTHCGLCDYLKMVIGNAQVPQRLHGQVIG